MVHYGPANSFGCPICGQLLQTKQALGVHSFRVHGVRRIARRYLDTSVCPCCLIQYHSIERLVLHVHCKSPVCLQYVTSRLPLLEERVLAAIDANTKETSRKLVSCEGKHRAAAGNLRCYRLSGPLPQLFYQGNPDPFRKGRNRHIVPDIQLLAEHR